MLPPRAAQTLLLVGTLAALAFSVSTSAAATGNKVLRGPVYGCRVPRKFFVVQGGQPHTGCRGVTGVPAAFQCPERSGPLGSCRLWTDGRRVWHGPLRNRCAPTAWLAHAEQGMDGQEH